MQQQTNTNIGDTAQHGKPYHRAATINAEQRTTIDSDSRQSLSRPTSCRIPEAPEHEYIKITEHQQQLLIKLLKARKAIKQDRKAFMKMRKRSIARHKHIEELVQTEKDYIHSVEMIVEKLRKPLLEANLISARQSEAIFGNMDSILNLHATLEKEMSKRYQVFTLTSTIGDIVLRNAPFFKIYVEYVQMYLKGSSLLYDMAAKNPAIQAVLNNFQATNKNDARSFLVKPVQRFQKYHVLLEPIIKQTDVEHKDHQVLTKAYQTIKHVVEGVNEMINKIDNSIRFNELCEQFANESLYEQRRELLFESRAYWITGENMQPVTAYFLTDLIFFASRELSKEELPEQQKFVSKLSLELHHTFQPKILARFKWDRKKSSFQDVSDGKTMKNLINLSTESGPVTISTGDSTRSEKEKKELLKSLNDKYMVGNKKDETYRVEVKPLGTEELNSTSLSKHTIYIIEVKIGEIRQNLYIRFKEMEKLAHDIQQKYPDLAKKLPTLTKKFLDNHRSKTIETRKLTILEFLQVVLNEPDVRADPTFVVRALKLKENFYSLPKIINERIEQLKQSTVLSQNEPSFVEILCATDLQLGRYSFHSDEVKRPYKGEEAPVDICLMTGDVERIIVTEFDTVEDVCNKVSRKVGMNVNRDFRLFHEVGKKESRALDHDQVVMKLFDLKITEETGFFAKLKSSIKGAIMPDTRPILIFKKYYYLPHRKEQEEYKRDLVRLRLLVYQVFTEIKEHKYQLSYEDYAFFGALLFYIIKGGEVESALQSKHFDVETIIERLIPEIIYKNESLSNDSWRNKILGPLERIKKEIDSLKEHNMSKLSEVKSSVKLKLLIEKEFMCYQIVLNKIKSNPLYNSNLFYVQPHDDTLKRLQEEKVQTAHNMWLAIKPECLAVLKPSTKETLFEIQYNNIESKEVYPSSVIFQTYEGKTFRFNTYQSFEISQLVEYNTTLGETLKKMTDSALDLELKLKTSIYMNDIQAYRNSQ